MNKHQKVFYLKPWKTQFVKLSPQKLIYSPVWFVVKARRDTAVATGMCIYIFSEPTILHETYENVF